jgi:hypothetical protein
MIGLPPSELGADQTIVARALPGLASRFITAVGVPRGVTALEGADAGPSPSAFFALTVNVYAVPWTRLPINASVVFPTCVEGCGAVPMNGVTT